ncbi:uncharacterized protein si:ch211-140l13.3 isoform X2 [Seriola aureovittata]|uniref:uncharacterized protein si:ch211-140l13.3 isoform X2 n=1 Tax=Seriola aureovittata TaxID=2871759 RepID=UPI0024BF0C92|nr:uncharacterized protein si:ch211-140l13.3 isoform X2 [Seriola aureovittata]
MAADSADAATGSLRLLEKNKPRHDWCMCEFCISHGASGTCYRQPKAKRNTSAATQHTGRRPGKDKSTEYLPVMYAQIPMERTSPSTDPSQSAHSPASVSPTSGISGVEHQGYRLSLLPCQGEPVVDRTHPYVSSFLSPYDAVPIGQSQLTAANMGADASQTINQTMQQASDHPCDVVQQQIEQIHKVLQEQGRLLTLLGTGLTFPAYAFSLWRASPPVLTVINSEQLPVFAAPSPPSDGRRPEDHPHVPTCPGHGGQNMLKRNSLKPEMEHDDPDQTKMRQTSWGFHRENLERSCKGGDVLGDRKEGEAMRSQHSLDKLDTSEVEALRQQMEALQQQFKQRESDWSVVRHQLQELIRENCELRRKLTAAPQCPLLARRCTAAAHTLHQEEQTEMERLLSNRCNLMTFTNRTKKDISAEQKTKTVAFVNGDVKHILEDGKVVSSVVPFVSLKCITTPVHRQHIPSTQVVWRSFTSPTSRLRGDTLGGKERSYFQTRPSCTWSLTAARGRSSAMAPSFTFPHPVRRWLISPTVKQSSTLVSIRGESILMGQLGPSTPTDDRKPSMHLAEFTSGKNECMCSYVQVECAVCVREEIFFNNVFNRDL